ncbi:MAG: HD domain-containing protein, partial [Oscillospiraceae bacterium]|nr:HD domain-containing protein [Oscillospiraceae bacterium]
FLSGLLMHTLNMMRTADFLAGLYGDIIDRDLLLAGTMLHDMGKREEFSLSQLGLVSDYTPRGKLLGHLYICAEQVAALARELGTDGEKAMLLQHMILSHHGTPEFGAAVVPQCAESELLSYIDLIDSRMEIYAETLGDTPQGQFSARVYALDKAIYNHG